jgi:uncharacterized membrane protein YcaP (DUF421 family)
MDPLRIAVRAGCAFVWLMAMMRLAGKRSIRQGTAFDFVLALIYGDLVDDLLWAEVGLSAFVTAVSTLFLADVLCGRLTARARYASASQP